MNKEEFIRELAKLNINITDKQLKQLDIYYHFLVDENEKYNLTNITKETDVYLKHFYAGFPGMVLKIIFPNIKIDLLDATAKKCSFLNQLINKLELKNINVINDRAELYSRENREKYDIVTSRAVAPLKHLLEYSVPMLKIDGKFIALKSNITDELQNIDNYYKKLFLKNEKIIEFKLPNELSNRTIYEVSKTKSTSLIYPRPYSQIKKKDI